LEHEHGPHHHELGHRTCTVRVVVVDSRSLGVRRVAIAEQHVASVARKPRADRPADRAGAHDDVVRPPTLCGRAAWAAAALNRGGPAQLTVVGSVNLDLVVRVERFPRAGETLSALSFERIPGGKGANQAVAAARLGAEVRFVGCVGRDCAAAEALVNLLGLELDVRETDAPTGLALITYPCGRSRVVNRTPPTRPLPPLLARGAPVDVPGLFRGLSGVGLQLLRLAFPERVPSPLLLD
jgi:hypothetical protein